MSRRLDREVVFLFLLMVGLVSGIVGEFVIFSRPCREADAARMAARIVERSPKILIH